MEQHAYSGLNVSHCSSCRKGWGPEASLRHGDDIGTVSQESTDLTESGHLIHDLLGIKRCTTLLGSASPARFQIGLGELCASYAVGRCRRTDTHAVDRPVPIRPRGPTIAHCLLLLLFAACNILQPAPLWLLLLRNCRLFLIYPSIVRLGIGNG